MNALDGNGAATQISKREPKRGPEADLDRRANLLRLQAG